MFLIEITNHDNGRYSFATAETEQQRDLIIAGIELVHDVSGAICYSYDVKTADEFYRVAVYRRDLYPSYEASKQKGAVYLTDIWIASTEDRDDHRKMLSAIHTTAYCLTELSVMSVCLVYPDGRFYRSL